MRCNKKILINGPIGPILISMSIGRPQEFNVEKVLESAMDVFWSNGYEATSMQMLLKSTGLSKSSLYQSFGDKEEIFLKCLEMYILTMKERLLTQLSLQSSGIDFIRATLLSSAEEAKRPVFPRGCLLMNTATEFAQSRSTVSKCVNKGIETFKAIFMTALKKAISSGEIDKDTDIEQLAAYIVSSMSGIKSMVKGGADEKSVICIVQIVMKSIK